MLHNWLHSCFFPRRPRLNPILMTPQGRCTNAFEQRKAMRANGCAHSLICRGDSKLATRFTWRQHTTKLWEPAERIWITWVFDNLYVMCIIFSQCNGMNYAFFLKIQISNGLIFLKFLRELNESADSIFFIHYKLQ